MYNIFLSPSTQPFNKYVNGGDEQEYMNKIADAMEVLLVENNIYFTRNKMNTSVGVSVKDSNSGVYDLHLSLHSNAAPESLEGKLRGIDIFYYPSSKFGKSAAKIIANNLKDIYPLPNLVKAVPHANLIELSKTNAPAVLAELGYHDNVDDEAWIKANVENIAENLVLSLCEYFGIDYINEDFS